VWYRTTKDRQENNSEIVAILAALRTERKKLLNMIFEMHI